MKKKIQYLVGTVLLVLVLNSSAAAAGYYIGIQGGAGFLPDAKATDSEGQRKFQL